MPDLAELNPIARNYILDCPDWIVARHMNSAARQFCVDTQAWRDSYDVKIQKDQYKTYLGLANDEALVRVVSMVNEGDQPVPYTLKDYEEILLSSPATQPFDATITVALKPSLNGDRIGEHVFNQWGEFIAYGCVERTLLEPNRPWSNPGLAKEMGERFQDGVREARQSVDKGARNIDTHVKMRPFVRCPRYK